MEVITDPGDVPDLAAGSAVTIGAYDGVHRGHQALLAELRRRADTWGLPTVVVTFDRHPASVVRPESAPRLLTDLDQKLEVLAATGDVDWAVVISFDAARAAQDAGDFVRSLLVGTLGARLVVVGEDFHFGRKRRGNVALLRHLGVDLGFEVDGFGLVEGPGMRTPVSSTAVRNLVAAGDVVAAAELLGRRYEVRGTVSTGDRHGRELGYPTAKVVVPGEILLPGTGIYAGWHQRPDGQAHAAAISVGHRPTLHGDARPVLETHLIDFDGDLYSEAARVRFLRRLRDEVRFDSADALTARMALDVEATRTALAAAEHQV
ncbi:MAG: bifunctional riboflavin kinase/FAD synthetase [Acidimicrobiales bacterium]